MEFQDSGDTTPSTFITAEMNRSLIGRPPATGAWRDGDPAGDRQFALPFDLKTESGKELKNVRIAFETWGTLDDDRANAVLVLHGLTGDSHAVGEPSKSHPTSGWWDGLIGPGKAIDTDKYFVVAPNVVGGCQGSTGPATLDNRGREYGSRFPFLTIRDQAIAQHMFAESIGIRHWHAIIGGSMGGMHVLEWAILYPEATDRIGVIAAPAISSADQIALNSVQIEAVKTDPAFNNGNYYDAKPGQGPHKGLALARRMALLNYRSSSELNDRFERTWQSNISPIGDGGRFAVVSYLDFHGNKFTRRFDANSYITLVQAMNSHDVGRGRESAEAALAGIRAKALVIGISSDRLFPLEDQRFIAEHIGTATHQSDRERLIGGKLHVVVSPYGHDSFLIEDEEIGPLLTELLDS
ncbi:MAG: homoserine O-acetyltransferase [Micrococcales bacterium]